MSIDDVDRAIVLSYAGRIPWDRYVGAGSSPGGTGANIFLEASDVELIKRYSALEAPAMTVALASEPVRRPFWISAATLRRPDGPPAGMGATVRGDVRTLAQPL